MRSGDDMMWLRGASIITGLALVAAATWSVIEAKALSGAQMWLQVALASGVCVASMVVGRARHVMFGSAIVIALLAGEAYQIGQTADRVVATREGDRATIKNANSFGVDAQKRLDAAEARLREHDKAAMDKIALRDCRNECRGLLDTTRVQLAKDVADARDAKRVAPASRSASPFADVLRLEAWQWDLIQAVLFAFGLNGLAVLLLGWGVHAGVSSAARSTTVTPMKSAADVETIVDPARGRSLATVETATLEAVATGEPAEFLEAAFQPARGERVSTQWLYETYSQWCERHALRARDARDFVATFSDACEARRVRMRKIEDEWFVVDMRLKG